MRSPAVGGYTITFPLRGRFISIAQAKCFTLAEYHRLGELGFFHEDDHIELINGQIIEMASKGTAHETFVS